MAVIGDLKYGPDFPHFDYVNPEAPRGGRIVTQLRAWALQPEPEDLQHAAHLRAARRRRGGDGADLRLADDRLVRRARQRLRLRGARGGDFRRPQGAPLLPAARGGVPRRHAASRPTTSPSRSRRCATRAIRTSRPSCRASRTSRSRTTDTLAVTLQAGHGAQPAAHGRGRADLLARLVGADAISRPPTARRRSAPAPTRSATFSFGSYIEFERRRRLVGGRPAGRCAAASTSTASATNITATAPRRSRPSRRATSPSARSSRRASGRRATTSRR